MPDVRGDVWRALRVFNACVWNRYKTIRLVQERFIQLVLENRAHDDNRAENQEDSKA